MFYARRPPSELPHEAERIIAKQLSSTEKLLWAGRPRQGLLLRRADLFGIPFSLVWGGFAFFWMYMVLTKGAPLFAVLWGIPFVLMGLYMIFGRFLVDARQRANTYYGVTNERIIIVSGSHGQEVISLPVQTLTNLTLVEGRDRSGTILFNPEPPFGLWLEGWHWPGMPTIHRFELIDEVKTVYELIRSVQNRR
jgi:hypothetical protein